MDINSLIAMWLLWDDDEDENENTDAICWKSYIKGERASWYLPYFDKYDPNNNRSSWFIIKEASAELEPKITGESGDWGTKFGVDSLMANARAFCFNLNMIDDFRKYSDSLGIHLIIEDLQNRIREDQISDTKWVRKTDSRVKTVTAYNASWDSPKFRPGKKYKIFYNLSKDVKDMLNQMKKLNPWGVNLIEDLGLEEMSTYKNGTDIWYLPEGKSSYMPKIEKFFKEKGLELVIKDLKETISFYR